MRHRKKKKILGRKKSSREFLIKNLAESLVMHEKIKTTKGKAKVLQAFVERNITKGSSDDLHTRRYLLRNFSNQAATKIIKELAPKYKERKGGYTRLINLKNRKGDNAPIVLVEFV